MQHTRPQTQLEQMYRKNSHTHAHIYSSIHTYMQKKNCPLCISILIRCGLGVQRTALVCICVYVCACMCHTQDALPPTVPLAGLHLSQSCAKAKVRCCCLAAGLNTAHCVSAPSQPQTVPTNVLLIRWLNYSCKNNVDISLKIAVCQILLANLGLQPLLSELLQRPSLPPSLPPADSSPL